MALQPRIEAGQAQEQRAARSSIAQIQVGMSRLARNRTSRRHKAEPYHAAQSVGGKKAAAKRRGRAKASAPAVEAVGVGEAVTATVMAAAIAEGSECT
jgi:hypothetical protein